MLLCLSGVKVNTMFNKCKLLDASINDCVKLTFYCGRCCLMTSFFYFCPLIILHMKKLLFVLITFSLLISACDYAKEKATNKVIKSLQPKETPVEFQLDESEKFNAIVELDMTLAEVADTNSVSISFLKQSLGIPHYVDHPYTVLQLSRNYQFTADDLKRIIDGYKDDKAVRAKKSAAREKENN